MKFIFQPVKNYWINQKFGADEVCVSIKDGKTCVGRKNGICPVGYESLYKKLGLKGHTGLDIMAPTGTKLYASQNGFVEEVQTEVERGLGIGIITNDKFFCQETGHNEHFKIRYWHLQSILVTKGQQVKIGDVIGLADNTGYSSGSHLHFEVKPVRQESNKTWRNVLQDNGYYGSVDPYPYMETEFALDFAGRWKKFKEISASVADLVAKYLRK